MKRLMEMWKAICSGREEAIWSIRALAVLSFAAVVGVFLAREFHRVSLGDFCGGLALSFSGILMFQVFGLRRAEYREDPHDNRLTELHLSR
jgi:hypothetical protein